MRTFKQFSFFLILLASIYAVSCKKDKKGPSVPTLTTTAVSAITGTTATGGGNITSDGGEDISVSGICWGTNPNPTISNDTTKTAITSGSFTATLKNLNPSTKYYVRAYATNRIGTGYGQTEEFTSGNGAPVATAISISGTPKGDELLTGNYTYFDAENDTESGTTFQWYMANDGTGAGETPIEDATEKTFRVQPEQEGKYIRFGVTPKSSAGSQNGAEVKSSFIGAVGEATTVTFTYNGAEVTYGILTSSATGKKWLDRNIGATRVAQFIDDYQGYGDLFQWGRLADGHQLITRTGGTDAIGANGNTSVSEPYQTSNTNTPATNKFIVNAGMERDWRVPQENSLWQGVNGANNPCPSGWRIPTKEEWHAEAFANGNEAYEKLKLTLTGQRSVFNGTVSSSTSGLYWTSSGSESLTVPGRMLAFYVFLNTTTYNINPNDALNSVSSRGNSFACRCIKN